MKNLPIFVRIEDPSHVHHLIAELHNAIHKTREYLEKVKLLNETEEAKLAEWHSNFEYTTKKIDDTIHKLADPENT